MNDKFRSVSPGRFQSTDPARNWIWEGYAARGQMTLFTSVWKSGKTTLLSHLLAQRRDGGALADKAVTSGASLIVSEESEIQWHERHARLALGANDQFYLRPFIGLPLLPHWQEFIAHLGDVARAGGQDLIVIDPLGRFLPAGAENNRALLVEALTPLMTLAQEGMGILLIHHPRKAPSAEGMAARGSGALPALVDFLLEMRTVDLDNREDRRRRLIAYSRDAATPRSQIIELSADGMNYVCREEPPMPDDFNENWAVLRMVLEDADHELTREEIDKQWPTDFARPKRSAMWNWLNIAHDRGLMARIGSGHRFEPYRFFLPEKMAQWQADPMFAFHKQMREADEAVRKMTGGYRLGREDR